MPYACEMVGMGVQRMVDTDPNGAWALLQIDMRNAFNTISRKAMLVACAEKTPAAFHWLKWCYMGSCALFSQGQQLVQSTNGVHQGDAMGPLGFALGLDMALDKCLEPQAALKWTSWYLDDGSLIGRVSDLAAYFECLLPALSAVGLEVRLDKCALWGPGASEVANLHPNHPLKNVPITPFTSESGVAVLGVPVDVPSSFFHGRSKWAKASEATITLLHRLRFLPDGQLRHCLLRHCLDACRVTHLKRSTPHAASEGPLEGLSGALRVAVADLVG